MTIIKHPNQRVGVFIDAQNLYHSGKNLYGRRVNFKNIMDVAISGRSLIRSLAYVITTESGDEQTFFEALTKLGVETKAKDLQIFSGGAKKGDWDVGLAIDAVTLAPKLDTVVLVTGDGDFVPLVEYLKKHSGCQVEVISFSRSSSAKLIESCDDFYDMCDNPNHFLIHGGKKYTNNHAQNKRSPKKYGEKSSINEGDDSGERVIIQRAKVQTAEKPAARKTATVKKSTTRRTTARKAPAKKSTTRRTTARKAPAKK